jgi:hypothetical protein
MAQIVKELRVDVSQPNVFQAIVAKQHDSNSRFLKITLVDFGVKVEVPNTAKVTINANRPDGASESFKGEANDDGTITVPLAQWMLDIDGEVKCDVSVTNTEDNKRLTSTDFWLEVQKAANPNASIPLDPDGEILIIKPVTEINGNSKDTDYPSAKAVYDYGQSIAADTQITATATGSAITIESSQAPLQNLKLFGKTTQDGTPTPDNPIELKSVGDSGSFMVGVYGRNLLEVNNTTQTKNGVTFTNNDDGSVTVKGTATAETTYLLNSNANLKLPKGKYKMRGDHWFIYLRLDNVTQKTYSGYNGDVFEIGDGNYTFQAHIWIPSNATVNFTCSPMLLLADETDTTFVKGETPQTLPLTDTLRGIGDIADEKDFARGMKVQRYEKISLAIADMNNADTYPGWYGAVNLNLYFNYDETPATKAISNISNGKCLGFNKNANVLWLPVSTFGLTQTQWKEQYPNLVVEFLLPLLTPIETPLTETELNAYRHLMTNKGTTTILSEADMEISYYVDKPNAQAIGSLHEQINKDYLKLQQAIISTGGSTL